MRGIMTSALVLAAFALTVGCEGSAEPAGPEEPETERFVTSLSASNVIGATIDSPGTGSAAFEWDGSRLTFSVNVQNMNQVIMAHIHGPASASQNASIILDLFIPANPTGAVNGELASGAVVAGSHLLVGGTSLDTVLSLLRSGQAYVLVHTTPNPDGEIRGQVQPE